MSNKTARNEQRKLSATYLNNTGVAVFAAGAFSPLASFVVNPPMFTWTGVPTLPLTTVFFTLGCFAGSLALHLAGRWLLGRCEE